MAQYLVVGLGNPGKEYARSPHNVGFMVVDRLAEGCGARVRHKDSRALVGQVSIAGTAVLLAKPQTFMNLSGEAVRPLLDRNGLTAAELIVVYDDHDLPWQALRIRPRGSAGGHHGMESVIRNVGTTDFTRVRLGIDFGRGRAEPEYLLTPLRREQREQLDGFLDYAAQAVVSIISEGVEMAMRIYEEMFIVRPDASEEEIDQLIDQTRQVITSGGGKVEKADKWGLRKLAYRVAKRDEGFYVLMQFSCAPDVVKEIERRFRVTDLVLKFLTVRIDERLKKIEKRRKQREKRAKRRPAPAAAASSGAAPGRPAPAPVAEQMMAEAAAEGAEKEQ
jgi:aminoacyl-tRNA hydrolase/ribosomal protein S6